MQGEVSRAEASGEKASRGGGGFDGRGGNSSLVVSPFFVSSFVVSAFVISPIVVSLFGVSPFVFRLCLYFLFPVCP